MTPVERLVTWMLVGFTIGALMAWAFNYRFSGEVTYGVVVATGFATAFLVSRTHRRQVSRERLSPADGRRR